MTVGECHAHSASRKPEGWYKNHWSWCQTVTIHLTLHGRTGQVYGRASYQSTEIGRGYAGSRHVTVAQYISEVEFSGDWTSASVDFRMACRGIPQSKHCKITRGAGGGLLNLYAGYKHTVHFRMD